MTLKLNLLELTDIDAEVFAADDVSQAFVISCDLVRKKGNRIISHLF